MYLCMHVSEDTLLAEASGLKAGVAGCREPHMDARRQSQVVRKAVCALNC